MDNGKTEPMDYLNTKVIDDTKMILYRTKHFPCGIVFIIYILRHSSFWQPLYLKSFQKAKICRYTARNDKQNEATLVNIINEGEVQGLQVILTFCSECTIENE